MDREIGVEGVVIFSVVAYETIALAGNALIGRKILLPITDLLGPLTHHPWGKIGTWMLLGWAFDHFWKRGEREIYGENRSLQLHDGCSCGKPDMCS